MLQVNCYQDFLISMVSMVDLVQVEKVFNEIINRNFVISLKVGI